MQFYQRRKHRRNVKATQQLEKLIEIFGLNRDFDNHLASLLIVPLWSLQAMLGPLPPWIQEKWDSIVILTNDIIALKLAESWFRHIHVQVRPTNHVCLEHWIMWVEIDNYTSHCLPLPFIASGTYLRVVKKAFLSSSSFARAISR